MAERFLPADLVQEIHPGKDASTSLIINATFTCGTRILYNLTQGLMSLLREHNCEDCRGNGFNTYICGHCQNASISDGARIGLFTTGPLATGSPNLKSSRSSSPESSVSSLDRLPQSRNLDPPQHGHRR
ncbi:hypothetical protein H112_06124 [Trichophyton rubrum D6]|uniref:Uncharacterized protein n=3 Tax=Trichophyton TaxID=5550 RepID=F2SM99_TRIRC|nr:uncharacterized protein TERG_03820 [Trichophyton rubrum CBS 118892]EZF14303.1 hypothetical protein H100_06139 [Trichophyton rubrum MR850]EZF39793.1 hypothetical protein H102_06107 [Trichophyton rubrum CBS 100081]EZF50422.1 hypothetical protein H103_06132 [Trichophyton rubrum CBS 288.86]EZF61014.1 hypothetical protein H104_06119 [Trichophyton rubrum CBS 289.86]EZF71688.1 hypothetical protein H105_06144 [Trichophyton soudanense CBS 452.61]EZF82484.1 hypothetical protein H110_06127 [Trichophy